MTAPTASAAMLVRASAHDAFEAFADPERIREFWLEHSSGRLKEGATVHWRFLVPGAEETVRVTAVETDRRIAFDWSDGLAVELRFTPHGDAVRVGVRVSGFTGTDAAMQAVDATEGFAIVLCDLKCLLETGRSGGMVSDKALLIAEASASGERDRA